MQNLRAAAFVFVCCVATSGFSAGLTSPNDLGADRCVALNSNAKIVWTAPASGAIRSARVYFRSANAKSEHFVEMKRGRGTTFAAILPKAAPGASAIDYRIAAAALGGVYSTESRGRVTLAKSCAADALTAEETKQAASIVVGLTAEGPVVPVGFRCDGIVGEVDRKGELRAYSACSEVSIAAMSEALMEQGSSPAMNRPATVAASTSSKTSAGTSAPARIPMAAVNGVSVGPLHHRTQRRSPNPATPPSPRLQEPVSPSRP